MGSGIGKKNVHDMALWQDLFEGTVYDPSSSIVRSEHIANPDEEWHMVLHGRAQFALQKVLHRCRTCCYGCDSFVHVFKEGDPAERPADIDGWQWM